MQFDIERLKEAYQRQGIMRYLEPNYGYSEAYDIAQNTDYSVDQLRYRYNVPDTEVNRYWYLALNKS